jgi:hypothetical protein
MAYAEIDRQNCEIRLLFPTNESVKKLEEWEEELNNYNLYIHDKKTGAKRHIREIVPDIQRYVIKCLRERVCCVLWKYITCPKKNL